MLPGKKYNLYKFCCKVEVWSHGNIFFYILLLWITLLNTIKFGIDKYLFVLNYKNELEIFKILNSFIKCYIKFYFSFLTTPGLIEGFRKDNDKLYFCKFWNNSYTISETILQATNKLF